MNRIIEQLHRLYAAKKYDPTKKLSAESIALLESVIQLSPSSFGLQPYKVLIVLDDPMRTTLRAASHDQPQTTDASHLFVFAIETISVPPASMRTRRSVPVAQGEHGRAFDGSSKFSGRFHRAHVARSKD